MQCRASRKTPDATVLAPSFTAVRCAAGHYDRRAAQRVASTELAGSLDVEVEAGQAAPDIAAARCG